MKESDINKKLHEEQKKAAAILDGLNLPPGEYIIYVDKDGNGVRVEDIHGNVVSKS